MCDLRVGKVVSIENHPQSDGLYVEQIDIGEGQPRQIGSNLRKEISEEELLKDFVVVFANLKEIKLGGVPSNGMVVCARNEEDTDF